MATFSLRYARAFQQVAAAQHLDRDQVRQQLSDISATLDGSRELREFLGNPSLEQGDKLKVLDAICGRMGTSKTVRNFIAVLMDHERLSALDEVIAEYKTISQEPNASSYVQRTDAPPWRKIRRTCCSGRRANLPGATCA